ncbi:helix-turn-helix domain-containing protein [Nocardia brasiliensis]|uniref:helix-turn-helix domain-containing protein n=1 Tax=Nocardia brasiliensis TaxID=37326 RepID=UPI002457A953|nr:helix-turn-helix domain-containing protein [Nocardia brasiliensis]
MGGRIKRGSFGGDQFTQIANMVFRDPRLTPKAMGIFGHLSTHRDDFGVTVAMIARHMNAGESAIKSGLRELETFGYLERTQERNQDGTMGEMEYFVTDAPALELQNRRSNPVVENHPPGVTCEDTRRAPKGWKTENPRSQPVVENPPADDPPADDSPTKKINRKNISSQKTKKQAGNARAREAVAAELPACLPDESNETPAPQEAEPSPGAMLLARLPRRLATPQVIRQHGPRVDLLLTSGWPPDALYRRLATECDGNTGPGRLVTAIRDTPDAPPARATAAQQPKSFVVDGVPYSPKSQVAAEDSPARVAARSWKSLRPQNAPQNPTEPSGPDSGTTPLAS